MIFNIITLIKYTDTIFIKMIIDGGYVMNEKDTIITLYHGSDHKVSKPLFGKGKKDNDYGSGFYTTRDPEKAAEWAAANGANEAYVNYYEIG